MAIEIRQDYFVGPGQTVTIHAPPSYELFHYRWAYAYVTQGLQPPRFVNAGTINISGPDGLLVGFGVSNGGGEGDLFHNMESGVFRVTSTIPYAGSAAYGFYAPSWAIDVLNDGLFEVSGTGTYIFGVASWGGEKFALTNNGTVRVDAAQNAEGASLENGGAFTNNGLFEISGGESALAVYYASYSGYDRFSNHGTIRAASLGGPSIGIFVGISSDGGTYFNSGLIEADYAFWINPGGGLASTVRSPELLINQGEIRGAIGLSYGEDVLQNHGTISGLTELGEGDDLYDGASGRHHGIVSAGTGADRLIGGDEGEILLGEQGRDSINAGGGDDYVDGGSGSDALDGGSGFDTISYIDAHGAVLLDLAAGTVATGLDADLIRNFEYVIGSRYGDRLAGSNGVEFLEGAGGDDTISAGGGDDDLLGDAGNDSLTGGGGEDEFHFSVGDGHDVIEDFTPGAGAEKLRIYGYATHAGLSQVGSDTLVTLSAGDTILLRNVALASLQPSDLIFDPVPLAPTPAPRLGSTEVVNHDLVIAAGETYEFIDPDTNAIADQVFTGSGLVIEQVDDIEAADIFIAGTLRVEGGTSASRVTGIDFAIADGGPAGVSLISILHGGVVEIVANGGVAGMGISRTDGLWNAGTIAVSSPFGDATGFMAEASFGQYVNSGTIDILAGSRGVGAQLRNARDFFNSGTILVDGQASSIGVRFEGSAHPVSTDEPEFVNSGSIIVTDGTAALDSVGIFFGYSGKPLSFWNSGLIEADYAIRRFQVSFPDGGLAHKLYNQGEIRGIVELGLGDQSVYNSGIIAGRIELGLGADLYDGRGGTQSGGVFGGGDADTLIGGSGSETLDGGSGDDVLSGGGGTDILIGGAGNDIFHVEAGFGADEIIGFSAGGGEDSIRVSGYSSYSSIQQEGAHTRIVFSPTDSILLRDVSAAALTAADFQFNASALAAATSLPPAPTAPPPPPLPNGPTSAPAFVDAVQDVPVILTAGPGGSDIRGGGNSDQLTGGIGSDLLMGYAGADQLLGGSHNDRLFGGIGDDLLDGGAGIDWMRGGVGNDIIFVDNEFDRVIEHEGEGTDEIRTALGAYTLGANVEHLSGLSGVGQLLTGNGLDNSITGGSGNDRIDGGAGADVLAGGLGDDTYVVDASDSVIELSGGGVDTVLSAATFTLAPELENLILTGAAAIEGYGNGVANSITGNSAANLLDGGAGADRMAGGGGDDIYVVDNILDLVIESSSSGTDSVRTALATYSLASNVEKLIGTSNGGQALSGNSGADFIAAGSGDDVLDGAGAADTMLGGLGNDIYIVDNLLDVVTELAGQGDDEVRTALVAYSLAGAANVEKLTGSSAAGQLLSGNGLANVIVGGSGSDQIDGALGADAMAGGLGNDVYFADNAGDTISEGAEQGIDEVRTELSSFSLAPFANVENLTGGSGDQTLTGNGWNNLIDGGAGADAMAGGGGHDVYIVDNAGDTVTELDSAGTDEVRTSLGSKAAPAYALYVLPDNVESLTGTSAGAQGVRGNALGNVIAMGAGADLIVLDNGGIDNVNGGGGNDFIYYGATLTGADITNGGAGTDTLGLLGNYASGITFTAANLIGVERLALYTGGGTNSYSVTTNDVNVAAGGELFVTAASLNSAETLFFNGSEETDGRFTILGGSGGDTLVGGRNGDYLAGNAGNDILYALAGNDFIIGGLGADQLNGGGGYDAFRYLSTAESTTGSVDQILDFTDLDRIDLAGIDANANAGDGDTSFTFIGSNAFTNVAGQLRATGSGGAWTVEGDVNGDGLADLVIQVTLTDATPLGAGDFHL